jgi:anti-sigma factor RsiW
MTEDGTKRRDQELLSAYRDGELEPGLAREVEDRLAADAELRTAYLRLQAVSAVVQVRVEPDPGFVVRHREHREARSPVLDWTWRQLGFRLTATAATLMVAAGLSFWQAAGLEPESPAAAVAVVEEPGLFGFEGAILAAPEFETLAETGLTNEPVLVIALGGGFPPTGGSPTGGSPPGE